MDSSNNLTNVSNRTLLNKLYKEISDNKTPRPKILETLPNRNKYLPISDISTNSQKSNESRKRSRKKSLGKKEKLNDTSFISISACDDDDDSIASYSELMKSAHEYAVPVVRRKKRKEEVSKSFHVNLPRKKDEKSSSHTLSSDDEILDPNEILAEADALLSNTKSEKINQSVFLNTTKSYANITFKRQSRSPVKKSPYIKASANAEILEQPKGNVISSDSPDGNFQQKGELLIDVNLHANNSSRQQSSTSVNRLQNLNVSEEQRNFSEITSEDAVALPNSHSKKSQRKGKLLSASKSNANKSVNDEISENIIDELSSSQTKKVNKKTRLLNTTKLHENNYPDNRVLRKSSSKLNSQSKKLQKKSKFLNSSKSIANSSVDCGILDDTANEYSNSQPRNKKNRLSDATESHEHIVLDYEVQDYFDQIETSLSNFQSAKRQKNKASFNASKIQDSNSSMDEGREKNWLDINSETPLKIKERPILQRKLENYFSENSIDDQGETNSEKVTNVSEVSKIQTRSFKKPAIVNNQQTGTFRSVLSSEDNADGSERRTLESSRIHPTKGKSRKFSIDDCLQLSAIQSSTTPKKAMLRNTHSTSLLQSLQRNDVGSPEMMSKSFPGAYQTRSSQRKVKIQAQSNLEESKIFVETNNVKKSSRKNKTFRIPTSSPRSPRIKSVVQEVEDLDEMNDLIETEDSSVKKSTRKSKLSSETPNVSISRLSLRPRTAAEKDGLKKAGTFSETNKSHGEKSIKGERTYSEIPSTSFPRLSQQKSIVPVKVDLAVAKKVRKDDKSHSKRDSETPSTSFSKSARGKRNSFQGPESYQDNDAIFANIFRKSNKKHSKMKRSELVGDEIESTEKRKENEVKAEASRKKRAKRVPSIPQFPKQLTKYFFEQFAQMKLSRTCKDLLSADWNVFFELTMDSLQAYADHAGRKYIDGSDTELLIHILRYASDRHSLDALLEEYVPIEIRQLTQPIAQARSNPDDLYEL